MLCLCFLVRNYFDLFGPISWNYSVVLSAIFFGLSYVILDIIRVRPLDLVWGLDTLVFNCMDSFHPCGMSYYSISATCVVVY